MGVYSNQIITPFQLYQETARTAISLGIITQEEADKICRKGTRKEGLWKKQLRELQDLIIKRVSGEEQSFHYFIDSSCK
jgi:hypothetical protein